VEQPSHLSIDVTLPDRTTATIAENLSLSTTSFDWTPEKTPKVRTFSRYEFILYVHPKDNKNGAVSPKGFNSPPFGIVVNQDNTGGEKICKCSFAQNFLLTQF
jgi:hypothetical protein